MIKIAPSILSADFLKLGEEIRAVEQAGADRLHIDVMDGQFVPNISLGIPIVTSMRRGTSLALETHLMIEQPERYIEAFVHAGADILIVNQENSPHLDRTIQLIKGLGKKAGVALNPSTPACTLDEILEKLDLVLVMTVNPGFGGQEFIEYTLKKIRQVRQMLEQRNSGCELEVDGGIEPKTTPRVVEAGAGVLVAGTAVFGHSDGPKAGIKSLIEAAGKRKSQIDL
jgi:ribulose-phosphate 3-epimerase